MRTVFRYDVHPSAIALHDIPRGAKFRSAGVHGDRASMWWEIETDEPREVREFQIFGTGHDIPKNGEGCGHREWIATFFDGPFVWHLFEVTR